MAPGLTLLLCNVVLLTVGLGRAVSSWARFRGGHFGSAPRCRLRLVCFVWRGFAWSRFRGFVCCSFCRRRFGAFVAGLQIARIKLSSAIVLAVALTLLTIPTWSSKGAWIPNWALSWPAWYLVATARKPRG